MEKRLSEKIPGYKSVRNIGTLSLAYFGFAFVKAYNNASFAYASRIFEGNPLAGQDILSASMVVAFAIALVFAKHLSPLCGRRLLAPLLVLVMSAAAFLMIVPSPHTLSGVILKVIGASVSGGACALAILVWAELQSCLRLAAVVVYVSGGFLFGEVFGWLIDDLNPAKATIALSLCALGSGLSAREGYLQLSESERPRKASAKLHFPWRLVAILGVYELALGIQESLSATLAETTLPGMITACLLVLLLFWAAPGRLNIGHIIQAPFLFVGLGLLASLSNLVSPGTAGYLLSVGYSSMFVILVITFCDISHRYGVSAIVLCSIKDLVEVFLVAGHGIGGALSSNLAGDRFGIAVIAAGTAILCVSLLLLAESRKPQWGLSLFGIDRSHIAKDPQAALELRIADMAETFQLSPRETEVFRLIALGKEPPFIEKELGIARGTLKSHTQRIYQKIGVHSRQELRAAVGSNPR